MHVPSKRILLLFGGWDTKCLDDIWIYSITENKWTLSPTKLPIKIQDFGYILTPNEKYILLFGGYTQKKMDIDYIHVLNVDDFSMSKSKIRCPENRKPFEVGICYTKNEDNKLIHGYMRLFCREYNMECLPNDIVNTINDWYSTAYIHLIYRRSGTHCKIALDHIFKQTVNL